ncbi:hypothetical protein JCM10213_004594 [Rhodosporidiobolus nylandii]
MDRLLAWLKPVPQLSDAAYVELSQRDSLSSPPAGSSNFGDEAGALPLKRTPNRRILLCAFLAGAACVAAFAAVGFFGVEVKLQRRIGRERQYCSEKEQLRAGASSIETASKRRYGPPPSTGRRREFAVGPKTLLTSQAPASSLYDGLRSDLKYLIGDSWSGMTGQFLTALSIIYLAQETQRVAVIPSPWRDNGEHYHKTTARMRDIFDMERFRNETGALFVELDQVKQVDPLGLTTRKDEVGCYHGNNWAEKGDTFPDFHFSYSNWRVPRVRGWAENSVESFVLFDLDERYRLAETERVAQETGRTIPNNMRGSHVICYSNIWALARAAAMVPGGDGRTGNYLLFDGLQREQGGMYELLDPMLRGKHPEWAQVGRYIDFKPEIWDVALFAVRKTLGTPDIPRDLITVHLRRGDFVTWCSRQADCVPQVEAYRREVDELLSKMPENTTVLATTDDTSAEFLSELAGLGWFVIDHDTLGTASLLASRYGELERGWYDSAVDQAIHSLGSAFVGTGDSQVSLVAALRVATWNGGETRIVRRP